MQNVPFDVFISYRQRLPDLEWVRGTLVERLSAGGVRICIDFKHFRLGEPLVTAMARAVEQSKYVLAVASPAYFSSAFTEFENIMSQHLELERVSHRLLVVKREPCDLPLRLRYKLWLSMMTDAEVAENLPRLAAVLREDPSE